MRILILIVMFAITGCRAWTTTKQYYDEYINPKAAVSYDVDSFSKLPQEFLDQYYAIDKKLALVVNTLNRNEAGLTEAQLAEIKSTYPWVSQIGLFDHVYTCMYGSLTLCTDSSMPEFLASLKPVNTTIATFHDSDLIIVNNVTSKDKQSRNIAFVLDKSKLDLEKSPRIAMVADGKLLSGPADIVTDCAGVTKELSKLKRYSDSMTIDGKKVYWVRSMASERIFYFYSK